MPRVHSYTSRPSLGGGKGAEAGPGSTEQPTGLAGAAEPGGPQGGGPKWPLLPNPGPIPALPLIVDEPPDLLPEEREYRAW